MKKKVLVTVFGIMLAAGLTGCDVKEFVAIGGETPAVSTETKVEETLESTEANIQASSENVAAPVTITEEELRALMDKNIYVNLSVFGVSNLPLKVEEIDYDKERFYQVKEEAFPDYAAFENYIRSVYCKETADMYLYKYPTEEAPMYVNMDGKLYLDSYSMGGKGYYVDWSEYTIEVTKSDENVCEFTVTATVEWPAENAIKEPYTVQGVAVKENGVWLLQSMIY